MNDRQTDRPDRVRERTNERTNDREKKVDITTVTCLENTYDFLENEQTK